MNIRELLQENKVFKHIEHFEDYILDYGTDGFDHIKTFIKMLTDYLNNKNDDVVVSEKFDGAPLLVFGRDPENGKFYLGTKSVFNSKKPKLAHSKEEIDTLYDSNNDLKYILNYVFDKLKEIYSNSDTVLSFGGDLLFIKETKINKIVDGKDSILFTPNTITYMIEVDDKNPVYKQINKADIGIALHTAYYLVKDKENNIIFNPVTLNASGLMAIAKENNVFMLDTNFKTLPKNLLDIKTLKQLFINAHNTCLDIDKKFNWEWKNNSNIVSLIKQFVNSDIKHGGKYLKEIAKGDFIVFLDGFKYFVDVKMKDKIESLKSVKGIKKANEEKDETGLFLYNNRDNIMSLIKLYMLAIEIKESILKSFEKISSKLGDAFIAYKDGFKRIDREGIVLSGKKGVVKFVDRLEFSSANFNIGKIGLMKRSGK